MRTGRAHLLVLIHDLWGKKMKSITTTLAAGLLAVLPAMSLSAEEAPSTTKFYDEETRVNLGGRWVEADIALYGEETADGRGTKVALVTDVTKFIDETERDLENWIATKQERCGERWSAGEPVIAFPDGKIRFALDLTVEVWTCGLRGRAEPSRFTRESGKVDVVLEQYVEDGWLQARLHRFDIDVSEGVSRYLPLEFITRRILNAELANLNKNTKFYRPPNPLYEEGFRYVSLTGRVTDGDRVIMKARFINKNEQVDLDDLATSFREEGLTQPPRPQLDY